MAARKTPQARKTPAKPSAKAPPRNKARPGNMGISGDATATKAARQAIYGMFGKYNIANGVTTKLTAKNTAAFMAKQFNTPGSINYRPTGSSASGETPFMNPRTGQRIGYFNNQTGEFRLEGGTSAGRRGTKGKGTRAKGNRSGGTAAGGSRTDLLGGGAGVTGSYGAALESAAGGPESFASGVSASTLQFVKEKSKSRLAEGESEAGKTGATKKKKKGNKRLVKRTVKKTNVKGKTIRKSLKSPGVTAKDKRVYRKVAKQASPKLSSRLRAADRRKKK